MDLVNAYGDDVSSDDDSKRQKTSGSSSKAQKTTPVANKMLEIAPNVETHKEDMVYPDFNTREIHQNLNYESLYKPVAGPMNPFKGEQRGMKKNHLTGTLESQAMRDRDFETQRLTYDTYGYAVDPKNDMQYFGDVDKAKSLDGATVLDPLREKISTKKRKAFGDPSDVDGYLGPWAGFEGELVDTPIGLTAEQQVEYKQLVSLYGFRKISRDEQSKPGQEQTIFHGKQEKDYLGRSYMHVPNDLDIRLDGEPGKQECYLPKKCIHTYTGHTKGVSGIKFFPNSGHLILSGSLDGKVKIWDVYHQRNCLRTYLGHGKAVRDIAFNNDGRQFLSTGYDKFVKLWDTETGKCVNSFTTDEIAYCVKFNPDPDKNHLFMAGYSNKKIIQWDSRSGQVIHQYDQHLGAVNALVFVDENRRFVSASDDKTVRLWEADIPMVVKFISDPKLHAVASLALHPEKQHVIGQSMNNQIVIYSLKDKFKMNKKKKFVGHLVAGYACQVNFSPDGRYVMSGESDGKLNIWEWTTSRLISKFKCHEKVLVGCEWYVSKDYFFIIHRHPQESSKIATCSWDGTIKLFD